jgi:hypothetical protein
MKILAGTPNREEFFDRIVERFPDRLNPTIVWLSATRLMPA